MNIIKGEECSICPWDVTAQFRLTKENTFSVQLGMFSVLLDVPESLQTRKWSLRDMNGHTTEPNLNVHSSYHFEVTVDPPASPDEVKCLLALSYLGPRKNNRDKKKIDFTMRLDGKSENTDNSAPFNSWIADLPQRIYDFRLTHEIFYVVDSAPKQKQILFEGFAFTIQNCHIKEGCKSPDWKLTVDTGEFLEKVAAKRCKGLDRTPIRADYGLGLETWQRAQGGPFWEMYRKGRIKHKSEKGNYQYVTPENYILLGGKSKLAHCGGSGAYKFAGKFISKFPDKPIESNRKMRIGVICEEPVMLSVLLDSPDNIQIYERGWVDFPIPTEDEILNGVSPDGIIYDSAMDTTILPEYRREKWKKAGWKIDDKNNTVDGADFTKGLLEIKVSETDDDMRDYYRIQCIWAMKMLNVYWARLVKLHTSGKCRSYLMYRDLDRELELVGIVAKTKARVGPTCTLVQSKKHIENTRWLKKMWGSAKWFNENKEICSTTIRWNRPEIKAYFAYIDNARAKIALSFQDLQRRPQIKEMPSQKLRRLGEKIENSVLSLQKAHTDVVDALKLPGGVYRETLWSLVQHNVSELLSLMENVSSE